MYYRSIESSAAKKAAHNVNMAAAASARLKKNAENRSASSRKAECAPNRKANNKLSARLKDWDMMTSATGWKGNVAGYHKPGSMKVH